MATWRRIASTEVDAESPVTSTLMSALADNPVAMAEQQSGAPKIAIKTAFGTGATITFTDLGDFGGVMIEYGGANSGASSRDINLQYSTDGGSTWSGSTVMLSIPASSSLKATLFFDFDSTTLQGVLAASNGSGTGQNTTVSGASLSIDAIRILNATDVTQSVLLIPNGGESAS